MTKSKAANDKVITKKAVDVLKKSIEHFEGGKHWNNYTLHGMVDGIPTHCSLGMIDQLTNKMRGGGAVNIKAKRLLAQIMGRRMRYEDLKNSVEEHYEGIIPEYNDDQDAGKAGFKYIKSAFQQAVKLGSSQIQPTKLQNKIKSMKCYVSAKAKKTVGATQAYLSGAQ